MAAPRKGRADLGVEDDERRGEYRLKRQAVNRGTQHYERPASGVRVDCGATVQDSRRN